MIPRDRNEGSDLDRCRTALPIGRREEISMLASQLIGSPRESRSRSDVLGTYLLERLKERGVSLNKVYFQ